MTEKRPRMRRGLFRKIFSRLFLAGMLSLFSFAATAGALLFTSYRESAEDFERTLLGQKRAEVERFLNEKFAAFDVVVQYQWYTPISYVDQAQLLRNLLHLPRNDLLEASIVQVVDTSALELSRLPDQDDAAYQLARAAYKAPVGMETMRWDKNDQSLDTRDRSADVAFQEARRGKMYMGDVVWREDDSGQPSAMVTIATPIFNQAKPKQIIGVLIGELQLFRLTDIFRGAGFGESGSVFLFDTTTKRLLAHSSAISTVGRDISFLPVGAASSTSTITETSLSGGRVLAAALPLRVAPSWVLYAEWPLRDAFRPIIMLFSHVLIVALLIGGALVVFATSQAREIIRPVRVLQRAAILIGRGQFAEPVAVSTHDELEDLAETLNRMRVDLLRLQEIRVASARAEALAQAVEKEQELYEAKDVLLSTASHQIRTPVSVLNWNLELLRKVSLPKDVQDLLAGIGEQVQNLVSIADDLLNATAYGAGYVAQPGKEPVDLGRTINEAAERYRAQAQQKGITLTIVLPPESLLVAGSFGALRVALENLIANAVTYTPTGGSVAVALERQGGNVARISVRDTGIGIPKEEQKHLFSSFFRASNAITMKNVGTGLGLFIVRNIVTGHGGQIDCVASEIDKGTEFVVTLPIVNAQVLTQNQ